MSDPLDAISRYLARQAGAAVTFEHVEHTDLKGGAGTHRIDDRKYGVISRRCTAVSEMVAAKKPGAKIVGVVDLTPEEARIPFDAEARRWLGISGEEFIHRWQAGEFRDADAANHALWEVIFLLPAVGIDLWP